MANTKISQLPQNNNPTGAEELVYALNNSNGKMTLNTMTSFTQSGMQPALISGTTIKTINGEDILGSGNLVITGGGGGGGNTVTVNSAYNASEGDAVMLNSLGQIEQVSGVRSATVNTGVDTFDSNSLLKSVKVADNKILYIGSVGGYITLYVYDDQGQQQKVTTTYRGYYFNVCCTSTGYAIVAFRDRDNSNKAYAFAVNCTGATPTYGTSIAVSSDTTKGSDNLAPVKVEDADSTNFCMMYVLNTDSKCYYSLCSFNTSTLAITTGTETLFNGNINTLSKSPFGYLGNGLIGYVYNYVDLGDSSITHVIFAVRAYHGGALGNMGTFDLADNLSISGTDAQIVANGTGGIISIDEHVWVYSFEDNFAGNSSSDYNAYSITIALQDGYHGSRKTYQTVDGGKYLMGAYFTPSSMILAKYIVSRAGMHKVRGRELSTSGANWYENLRLEEVGTNSGITNPADGDYVIIGLNNSSYPVTMRTTSRGGKFVGVASESIASGTAGDIIFSGVVSGTFSSAGNKVYVGNGVLTDTPTDYLVGFSLSNSQALLINGLK